MLFDRIARAGPDEVEAAVSQLLQQDPDLFSQLPDHPAGRSGNGSGSGSDQAGVGAGVDSERREESEATTGTASSSSTSESGNLVSNVDMDRDPNYRRPLASGSRRQTNFQS